MNKGGKGNVNNITMLGIDPGLRVSGYGVVRKNGSQTVLLDCGYLSMSSSKSLVERIGVFYNFFSSKIEQWQISDIALETPFLGKNAQNFLKLGYLRGIIYLLAHKYKTVVYEFSPREVKQSLTGFGGASKEQIARVMLQLFPQLKEPKKNDVTDALAITLCGVWQSKQMYY
jgi:crossover junction endodeoxyribonuclease RuvC